MKCTLSWCIETFGHIGDHYGEPKPFDDFGSTIVRCAPQGASENDVVYAETIRLCAWKHEALLGKPNQKSQVESKSWWSKLIGKVF